MLPRYNLAALPNDERIHQVYFQQASFLKHKANGYCLEAGGALPHVTLCQFRARDNQEALALTRAYVGRKLSVTPLGIYIRPGEQEHTGRFWVGHLVARHRDLMETQRQAVSNLKGSAPEVFNASGDRYFPHFTLARLTSQIDLPASLWISDLFHTEIFCTVYLGLSDETGQYLRKIDRMVEASPSLTG